MNTFQIVMIVVGIVLLGGVGACLYFGKDYLRYHKVFAPLVQALCSATKTISELMPNNGMLQILNIVLNVTVEGTIMAEDLWLNCTINKEDRNIYAKEYIVKILEKSGISVDENIMSIVNGVISFVCCLLPHGQKPSTEKEEA